MTKPRGSASGVGVLLAVGLALAGCGGDDGPGPEPVAKDFAAAWTEARCEDAMSHVASPDKSWTDACERTFHFGTKCDEVQPGDPRPVDCGPGTKITVRSTEVTKTSREGDTAELSVLVAYTQGERTRESRTLRLELRRDADGWKVTRSG